MSVSHLYLDVYSWFALEQRLATAPEQHRNRQTESTVNGRP